MSVKSHWKKVVGNTVVAASFAAAFAAPACAGPAVTTWTAYLYQGPGTRYAVVDEVPQGTQIDVAACASGWCRIALDRRIGYLPAEVVAKADPAHPAPGVLPQPAAAVVADPAGPCFKANQTGGNGGNAMTVFCRK